MESIWIKGNKRPSFPVLAGDIKTDVVIIGGGMAGILCAYRLKKQGVNCVLIEAEKICSGTTENTTAKITYQHGLIYDQMIRRFGIQKAFLYFESQKKAMAEYERLSQEISCDYEKKDSFVYTLKDRNKVLREKEALSRLGAEAEMSDAVKLPFSVLASVKVKDQAQFHPLKFAYEIAKDLIIYENTKAVEISPKLVITNRGRIFCEKVIVATHFPILNQYGGYFLKMYQHRSYVLALSGAENVEGIYVDEADKGLSFRQYGEFLFIGGGSHRTGKEGGGFQELIRVANKYYPDAKIVARWATQDCMTLDSLPYIGPYSPYTSDIFVATGFHKWGMTSSMAASFILADQVQGKRNAYASVYAPSRSMLRPQLAVNVFESAVGLLTPGKPRCSHLGCALVYNRQEHTWDCPCHGSRYSKKGEVIDNPALFDIEIKK